MKTQTQVMTYPSMSETLLPGEADSNVQRAVRYALLAFAGSALITLCTQISLPLFPVPMTLQTFAVFLIGLTYGWRLGGVTVVIYLLEGALGLPVFSGGKPGNTVFTPLTMDLINCPDSLNLEYICSNMFAVKAPILV